MSFWRKIMNRQEGSLAEIQGERDALREELELMRNEYEVLRRAAVDMMAAQKELQTVTYNLVEENKALRQLAHLNAFVQSGGVFQ